MSDKLDERLSALMDGEIDENVLSRLQQDEELKSRWMRYHIIRDVLSGHSAEIPSTNFAARVTQALQDEPTVLAPVKRGSRTQHLMKQAAGFAIAATVATVAIVSIQTTSVTDNQINPAALASAPVSNDIRQVTSKHKQRLDTAVESKLSSFIVNHNEYSLTAKMQGMLPYTRIVSVTPSERVVIRNINEK